MTKLRWIIFGLVIGLAGCAAQKPQMPDEKYAAITRGWITLTECIRNGDIDSDIGARGKAYIFSTVSEYQHDADKLRNTEIKMRKNLSVSKADCRELAVAIQTRKQQIENQNATAEMQRQEVQNIINSTKSTHTYCNKIGTQVLCNSF